MKQIARRVTATSTVLALALAGLFVPTVTLPLPEARAISPDVDELQVRGVDAEARRDPTALAGAVGEHRDHASDGPQVHAEEDEGRLAALSPRRTTDDFLVAGITWELRDGEAVTEAAVRLREGGRWGPWQALGIDGVEVQGGRAGTEPIVSTGATGIQARVRTESGVPPAGLRIDVVDPGTSPADASAGTAISPAASASAATGDEIRPAMVTRAGWGADESLSSRWPEVSGRLDAMYVHHTAGTNSYSRAQSAAIVRGIYGYHTRSRDWPDIGYHFLVDKFGTVFVGRKESRKDNPVGAQAGGYNTGTIGVAALGNFENARPTAALLNAIKRVLAWKAYDENIGPMSTVVLPTGGSTGSGTRAKPGTDVRVPRILGHRTTNITACPGRYLNEKLPSIRRDVRDRVLAAKDRYGVARHTTGRIDPVSASAGQKPIQWFSQTTYRWRGVDGAARYQVLRRFARYTSEMPDTRYWRKVKIVSGTSATLSMSRGHSVVYAVRPIDSKGRYGPIRRLVRTTRPVADTDVRRAEGTWLRRTNDAWYGGKAWFTDERGARLRVPGAVDVRSIRVVAPTAPGNGRVAVFVGGTRVGTINLSSVWRNDQVTRTVKLSTRRSGAVTFQTLDAGKVVRISGVGVSRW